MPYNCVLVCQRFLARLLLEIRHTLFGHGRISKFGWMSAFVLVFCFMGAFNITVVSSGPFSIETEADERKYEFVLTLFMVSAIVLMLWQKRYLVEIPIWNANPRIHQSVWCMTLLLIGCMAVKYIYLITFTSVFYHAGCYSAIDIFWRPASTIQLMGDYIYYACVPVFVGVVLYFVHLGNRRQVDLGNAGFKITSLMTVLILALLYLKFYCSEALELLENLRDEKREHIENMTVLDLAVNKCDVAVPQNLSHDLSTWLVETHPGFLAVCYLIAAEAIIMLICVMYASFFTHHDAEHTPPHANTNGILNDEQVDNQSSFRMKRSSQIFLGIITLLCCMVSLLRIATHTTVFNYQWSDDWTQLIKLLRRSLQILAMFTALHLRSIQQPALEQGYAHADFDALLLSTALPPIWVLQSCKIISAILPWNEHVDSGITHALPRALAAFDGLLALICYTLQFLALKRMLNFSDYGLSRNKFVVLCFALAVGVAGFSVWVTVFMEMKDAGHFIVTSKLYYPKELWATILVLTFPALFFFNFKSAETCITLMCRVFSQMLKKDDQQILLDAEANVAIEDSNR